MLLIILAVLCTIVKNDQKFLDQTNFHPYVEPKEDPESSKTMEDVATNNESKDSITPREVVTNQPAFTIESIKAPSPVPIHAPSSFVAATPKIVELPIAGLTVVQSPQVPVVNQTAPKSSDMAHYVPQPEEVGFETPEIKPSKQANQEKIEYEENQARLNLQDAEAGSGYFKTPIVNPTPVNSKLKAVDKYANYVKPDVPVVSNDTVSAVNSNDILKEKLESLTGQKSLNILQMEYHGHDQIIKNQTAPAFVQKKKRITG